MSQTIIEKAKRYDEIIEEIKGLLESIRKDKREILEEDITSIFPELKESEGEMIRKWLIGYFNQYIIDGMPQVFSNGLNVKEVISWLEKQGRHANFRNKIQIGDKVTRNEDGVLVNLSQLKRIAKEYNITGIGSKHAQGKLGEMIKNLKPVNEALEQNHANKAEPKFHEGEWIVWQDKCYKVNYNGCGYELTGQNGLNTSLEYGTIDENAHLFTIEDAKDGDVLAVDDMIFIYKTILSSHVVSYCRLIDNVFNHFEYTRTCCEGNPYIHPATKEQRDTLEKAMADAGYEWLDKDRKLVKIVK